MNQWICRGCGAELTALNVVVRGVCLKCNASWSWRGIKLKLLSWGHKLWPIGREPIKVIVGWTIIVGPLAIGIHLIGPVLSETFGSNADWVGLGLYAISLLIIFLTLEVILRER